MNVTRPANKPEQTRIDCFHSLGAQERERISLSAQANSRIDHGIENIYQKLRDHIDKTDE